MGRWPPRWSRLAVQGSAAIATVVVLRVLEQRWHALDHGRLLLYASLFAAYCLGERLAWHGRRDAGERRHVWLRHALTAVWLLVLFGAPVEHALVPRHGVAPVVVGTTLSVVGATLRFWGLSALGPFFSPHIEIWSDHELVERGPYRRIRHPAYAGTILHVIGMPMLLGAWISVALSSVMIALCIRRLIWEEEELARTVRGYADYMTRTKRLVPGIW